MEAYEEGKEGTPCSALLYAHFAVTNEIFHLLRRKKEDHGAGRRESYISSKEIESKENVEYTHEDKTLNETDASKDSINLHRGGSFQKRIQ